MDSAFGTLPDVNWVRRLLPKAHVAFGSNNRGAHRDLRRLARLRDCVRCLIWLSSGWRMFEFARGLKADSI
jgi:hypothetical protein